jgi:Domain of unknown function (DUF1877)
MGMIGNYLIVTQSDLDRLYQGSESVSDFLYQKHQDDIIDTDKAWHGIHFVLTGDAFGGEEPLANVVMGGVPIGEEDVGSGPARGLTVAEVSAVAAALQNIDETEFRKRIDLETLAVNDIYPQVWTDEDDLEYLASHFSTLRETFLKAAREGKAMIVFIN